MFIHAPEGTFDLEARTQVASELIELGLRCAAIPATAFVQSTVWLYFSGYSAGMVFSAGKQASARVMSLLVYVLEGGLESQGKQGATEILGRHAGIRGPGPGLCRHPRGAGKQLEHLRRGREPGGPSGLTGRHVADLAVCRISLRSEIRESDGHDAVYPLQ
ncbi:hypothetical protein, partial [Teichococcus vastitatis]|uniref:hypothetical protein n=1 Tax=Teichococcus vastitatis TaxID=2307076 RepID=UPI00192E46EB